MSAKDTLDSFQRDWESYLRWLASGKTHILLSGIFEPEPKLLLDQVPSSLRVPIAERLKAIVEQLAREEYAKRLSDLRVAAVVEAKETLDELRGIEAPE